MELIEGVDYYVRVVHMPNQSTPAILCPNADGTYDIYIDDRADKEHQLATLLHEIRHIKLCHFESGAPIDLIERQADGERYDPVTDPPPGKIAEFTLASFAHFYCGVEPLR